MRPTSAVRALAGSCHPGPTLVVTALAALLTRAAGHTWATGAIVVAAVFAGQLTIGWSNDLIDLDRDRATGRRDKPLAAGVISPGVVIAAVVLAGVACVALSLAVGWRSAAVHLGAVVGGGWAYNLGLKRRVTSWIPYAVAFGALPAVVTLAAPLVSGVAGASGMSGAEGGWPPWWMLATGALLGVGAHLLNAVPDLADDAATDVRGLPHALGETWSRRAAVGALASGTVVVAAGTGRWWLIIVAFGLSTAALRGRGQEPFYAAAILALTCVAALAFG
jgi:4-hydroxybenzoate polyprenyltransferase